jgi:hypothetical protein
MILKQFYVFIRNCEVNVALYGFLVLRTIEDSDFEIKQY